MGRSHQRIATGRVALTTYEDGVEAAGLLHTSPTLGSTAAKRFFALSIAAARKTLYITNAYFVPDEISSTSSVPLPSGEWTCAFLRLDRDQLGEDAPVR